MKIYHEVIEISEGNTWAVAVVRPVGAPPLDEDAKNLIRRYADTVQEDTRLYFTTSRGKSYIWHLIPSPTNKLKELLQ